MKAKIEVEGESIEAILIGLKHLATRIKEGKRKGKWNGEINMKLEIIES